MNIDDPLKAAEAQVASDERQISPVTHLVAKLAAAVNIKPAEKISKMLANRRIENLEYLFGVLLEEFKKSNKRPEDVNETHRRFLETEYVELVADGFRKAENIRAKQRIVRIGNILASAAEIGPSASLDGAEELMRVAMNVSDLDVAVLREIHNAQAKYLNNNQQERVNFELANDAWRESPPRISGISDGQIQSCCATLQSFGLLARVERNQYKLGPNEIPFALLKRGAIFIDFIRNS